jgi:hypothetical protein
MDVAVAIFATSAAVGSTVNLQGSLGEVSSAVMLASHRCAATQAQQCVGGMDWALAPVSYGPQEAPGLYGSFTVVAGTGLVHVVVCAFVKLAQGRLSDTLTNQERWDIAAAKTLYPNVTLAVLAFFYQGIILRTFQNFFAGKQGGYGFGISFVAGGFSLVLIGSLIWYVRSRGQRMEYKLLGEYRRLRKRTLVEERLIIPDGTWTTLPYIFRMGIAVFPYRPSRLWFTVVPWARMFFLGFIAAALETSCSAMYALSLVAFAVTILLVLVARPYRFGLALVNTVAMQTIGLLTCIMGLTRVALPCPIYLGVCILVTFSVFCLGYVGWYEQRNYRPEAEALEQREAVSNPLLGYL